MFSGSLARRLQQARSQRVSRVPRRLPRSRAAAVRCTPTTASSAAPRELANWTVRASAGSAGPVVTTAGRSCGAFIAELRHRTRHARGGGLRRARARLLHAARRHALDALHRALRLRVPYQDSCHLRENIGQKVTLEPRALLHLAPRHRGRRPASAGRCCGAAGTGALMRPDDSLRFLDPKLAEIAEADIEDIIVSGNPDPSCSSGRACSAPTCEASACCTRRSSWPSGCRGSRSADGDPPAAVSTGRPSVCHRALGQCDSSCSRDLLDVT